MEERFRALTFHGLVLRSQLVTLLLRGVCYAENHSVSTRTRMYTHSTRTRMFSVSVLLHVVAYIEH